jgi:hypothetical protein
MKIKKLKVKRIEDFPRSFLIEAFEWMHSRGEGNGKEEKNKGKSPCRSDHSRPGKRRI